MFYLAWAMRILGCFFPILGITVLMTKIRVTRLSQKLLLANVGCFFINIGYLIMLVSPLSGDALFGVRIEILGNALFYYTFLRFVEESLAISVSHEIYMARAMIELMGVLSTWMNFPKGFVIYSYTFEKIEYGVSCIKMEPGIAWTIRGLVLVGICVALLGASIRRMSSQRLKKEKHSAIRLFCAVFVSLIPLLLSFVNLHYRELFPSASMVVCMIMVVGILKNEFFPVTEQGRDWVIDHMDGAVVITDSVYGYLDANQEGIRLFPELKVLEKNQMVPKQLYDIIVDEDEDREVQIENRYYQRRVIELKQNKDVAGYALVLLDQTSLYYLIDQWKEEKRRADIANEEKSAFLSRMSHEIRTPMNAIVGMTNLLMRQNHSLQEQEYLANISRSGQSLLRIINDILDFSKMEAGKLRLVSENYNLLSTVNDLSLIFLNRIGSNPVELYYDIDPNLPSLMEGDELRIRQIIINLMNNAIKFTHEGYVRLSIKIDKESENEGIDYSKDEYLNLKITIEDTGCGIHKEELSKLFKTYEQANLEESHYKEGTGLGLAITKQLVTLMGGTINVESEYGAGSTFVVCLAQKVIDKQPAALLEDQQQNFVVGIKMKDEKNTKIVEKLGEFYHVRIVEYTGQDQFENIGYFFTDDIGEFSDEELEWLYQKGVKNCAFVNPMQMGEIVPHVTIYNKPIYSLSFVQALLGARQVEEIVERDAFVAPKAKVLVVDDNEMNQNVAKGLLEIFQIYPDTASDGKAAISMAQKTNYDLVFMDYLMPVMNGIEATRKIREFNKEVPIIAITAILLDDARRECTEAGMNDFLEKPIQMERVKDILLHWIPAEKMQEVTKLQLDGLEKRGDLDDKNLPQLAIEGISVEAGIKNCGNQKIFLQAIEDYRNVIEHKSGLIDEYLREGRIDEYVIEVHALKSSSRTIGALELASQFENLERLGNEGCVNELENLTDDVLKLYKTYDVKLQPVVSEKIEKIWVPVNQKIESLKELRDAVDAFDLDGADRAMKTLEGYEFFPKDQKRIELLKVYVSDVAMENILTLTQELIDDMTN